MKKLTLILLLSAYCLIAKSQITMLDTSYLWSYSSSCTYEFGSFTTTFQNSIGIDTIINGKTYKIIFDSDNFYGEQYDLFREDSGYVFHYSDMYGEEIYYDYNLQVGDTFYFPQTSVTYLDYVIVDSVLTNYLFGKFRKVIKFSDFNFSSNLFSFIEGVGSSFGPVYDHGWYYDCNLKLLCFTDSADTYLAPNTDSCHIEYSSTGIRTILTSNPYNIYPNPAHDKLYLQNTNGIINDEFIILNALGKIEKSIKLLNSDTQEIEVDINELKPGLYFIKAKQSGYSEKFIKN